MKLLAKGWLLMMGIFVCAIGLFTFFMALIQEPIVVGSAVALLAVSAFAFKVAFWQEIKDFRSEPEPPPYHVHQEPHHSRYQTLR